MLILPSFPLLLLLLVEQLLKAAEISENTTLMSHNSFSSTHWIPPSSQELIEREAELGQYEERISEMTENVSVMEKKLEELQEFSQVLSSVSLLLNQRDAMDGDGSKSHIAAAAASTTTPTGGQSLRMKPSAEPLNDIEAQSDVVHAQFIVGTVQRRKYAAFERVLWRAMRGNVYMSNADLPGFAEKSVFVAFAHGSSALGKIRKICQALGCRIYDEIGEDYGHRSEQLVTINAQIADITNILFNTRQARFAEISNIASALLEFRCNVVIQKAIYSALNLMRYDGSRKSLIAEAWCPTALVSRVDEALQVASERAGLDVASIITVLKSGSLCPPTHFPTNRFTQVFQDINDAYGVACYGEANPGLFMIVTFPFLFSLMFGDIGHAAVMLLVAVLMIVFERGLGRKAAASEMFSMIFDGRYIIALMGMFSIYAGFIYNDVFSKSISVFASMFNPPSDQDGTCSLSSPGYVYPFGFDPKWNHASNNLNFTNAVKLKLSIVIAILHMNLGICLSAINCYHARDWQSLAFHFLPQFLFFNCLFGYMAWMIVWKWITGIDRSILNTFIAMMMQLGTVDTSIEPAFYPYQELVQRCLVTVAFLCVPVMILGRPLYFLWHKKQIQSQGYQEANRSSGGSMLDLKSPHSTDLQLTGSNSGSGSGSGSNGNDEKTPIIGNSPSPALPQAEQDDDEDGFGPMIIHEAIHAIEFLLGSVSNTASYLRLWALSLAHAQLSEVLWSLCLEGFMVNPITLILGFGIWFFATLGLMVAMEGLSAFLHALRLHWVEFNSKFYKGQGVPFQPFQLNLATGESVVIAAVQPVQY